jgi:hypothetical protein
MTSSPFAIAALPTSASLSFAFVQLPHATYIFLQCANRDLYADSASRTVAVVTFEMIARLQRIFGRGVYSTPLVMLPTTLLETRPASAFGSADT